ncbi:cryptococcal mannosyltransferase 1-domain-containing protein [Apiosordaria backusii]|uniref:Cryptococcal mannosyltransferase 1-domain-containing protein n=1 Tax=Apiosordaria backusii TaxID=314023 RepID=A0AA39ZQ33_9PEZI|nr:cryptococcal mannosyltransferase 1-domain-containing protein [Apiosordaria backusii]
MTRRLLLFVLPAGGFLLLALTLWLGREQISSLPRPSFWRPQKTTQTFPPSSSMAAPTATPTAQYQASSSEVLPQETKAAYVHAIMHPEATVLPRLQCPEPDASRYRYLAEQGENVTEPIRYFIALDLRQCVSLLPRLLGSIVEAIRFLGPRNCALSIIEGNSDDGTGEVLAALRPGLDALTTTYYFKSSDINPKQGDRIQKLAQLRNMALQPLVDETEAAKFSTRNTTVVFLNDVAICFEDILELLHQRRILGADMTCAMDWTYVGSDPTFYDVWIARGMNGESFFEIPPDGNWNSAWNLFWNNPSTQQRFSAHQPFQVFSCWNGAAVFTATPIMDRTISFRAHREGECLQGEPQLLCKDMWFHGYGKIAVVPSVNLEYSNENGKRIKEAKGYVSRWVSTPGHKDELIEWQLEPPKKVKCIPNYGSQFFEAWNLTQPGI